PRAFPASTGNRSTHSSRLSRARAARRRSRPRQDHRGVPGAQGILDARARAEGARVDAAFAGGTVGRRADVSFRSGSRYARLRSATPVGNDLTELYNLILLLKPGLLSTEAQFRRDFGRVEALTESGRREKLRGLLREVMVRNTRAHLDVRLPRRLAATHVVQP